MDYRLLPGGMQAVTGLQKSHPDVQISCAEDQLCTLNGNYSKVQAALAQLIGHHGSPRSAKNISDKSAPVAFRSVQTAHYTQGSDYQITKDHKQIEKEIVHLEPRADEYNAGSHRDLTPTGYGREDTAQTLNSVLQVSEHPTTSEEDFSLMVDADVFQYLQKHYQKEYQHILRTYDVEVVDMTNQGLTTLFLQIANAGGEGGRELERLKMSRKAISVLCQKNESKICRDQLLKSTLFPRGGLQRALENLRVKFPKLLLKEDEINVYIIGSSSDVSGARQCLFLDFDKPRAAKDTVASLLGFSSHDSSSLNPAGEEKDPFNMSSPERTPDGRMNDNVRSGDDEVKRGEVDKKYKLAARFKDSGLASLGNRPTDFTFRGSSSSNRQKGFGPMLKHDILSGTAGHSDERGSGTLALNTDKDILFKSLPSSDFLLKKTEHFIDARARNQTSPISTSQSSLSPVGSGPTLRRASSFSGSPQLKAQLMDPKSKDDSCKSTVRSKSRSSSFSTYTERDVHNMEIRVSWRLWKHIRDAYRFQVDDLTSDVQMKESHPESGELTVTLKGASESVVHSCHLGLRKLIKSVSVDFCVKELSLSELGVMGSADETLQACCAEVRSRFKKVTISHSDTGLMLLGPELLCSQVAATLLEVFSLDLPQIPNQQTHSITGCNPSSLSQINEDHITSLHCNSNPQVMPQSKTGTAGPTGGGQTWRTHHTCETDPVNGSVTNSSVRKDPVIKEKVKLTIAVQCDGQKTDRVANYLTAGCDKSDVKHANGVGLTTGRTGKNAALQNKGTTHSSPNQSTEQTQPENPEESRSRQGHLDYTCVCGQKASPMMRTECGVTLCSKCLDTVHSHCRVCHETALPPQGIRGKMSSSRLRMSIPGYKKDCVIKITYSIPDGVQSVRSLT